MGIREDRAATMPHRRGFADQTDPKLESQFGRLRARGIISEAEYEAGKRYAAIIHDYLETLFAPDSFPDQSDNVGRQKLDIGPHQSGQLAWRKLVNFVEADIADDVCFTRKLRASQAREVLRRAAEGSGVPNITPGFLINVVDRVAVYEERYPIRTEREQIALHLGLRALAGMPALRLMK